jgi:hypothetical protein
MTGSAAADYGWSSDSGLCLPEKIRRDLKTALRNKDHGVRDALRQIMAEYPGLTVPVQLKSGKKTTRPKKADEITDDDVLDIICRLVKSEKIVLEAKNEASSTYLRTLERYLPRMATREEITAWIRDNIDLAVCRSPMQAMGPIMKHFGKQAEGRLVKQVLQELDRG